MTKTLYLKQQGLSGDIMLLTIKVEIDATC